MNPTTVIFDWDGTLLDTDEALLAPFIALGVAREDVPWGNPLGEACEALGISMADYLATYDTSLALPWPGVPELIAGVEARGVAWAVCSNKHPDGGDAELALLGWQPAGAWWSDAFGFKPKRLGPVLEGLGVSPSEVLYVGDTEHDVECADEVGVAFVLAGWNPRASAVDGVDVLARPLDVLDRLG
jgi:phosphoglycolate phosphatase-like HAD superfamily hydrolase